MIEYQDIEFPAGGGEVKKPTRLTGDQWSEKQEAFCLGILAGKTQYQSYLDAGYKGGTKNSVNARASGLAHSNSVVNRIAELRRERTLAQAEELKAAVAGFTEATGTVDPELVGDMLTRVGRAKALAARRVRLLEIVEARKKDVHHLQVPGGHTGFVTLQYKKLGERVIVQVSDNTELSAELRATEQQIARELGQWVERADETVTVKGLEDLDDAALARVLADAEEVARREGIELPRLGGEADGPGGAGAAGVQ